MCCAGKLDSFSLRMLCLFVITHTYLMFLLPPQNMHLQASSYHGLACYWSSWHSAARDSKEMQQFLGMGEEDKCLGFFMVAACDPMNLSSKRGRDPEKHLSVEWRN